MKKLTKTVIKDIVKECLVEILCDGLNENNAFSGSDQLKESLTKSKHRKTFKSKQKTKSSYLDQIKIPKNKDNKDKLESFARSVTEDPILGDMLADTAKTTLQEQIAAESKKGYAVSGAGDQAQRIVESSDPSELFGEESAGKWAHLAFGG